MDTGEGSLQDVAKWMMVLLGSLQLSPWIILDLVLPGLLVFKRMYEFNSLVRNLIWNVGYVLKYSSAQTQWNLSVGHLLTRDYPQIHFRSV